jgi:phosphopantetheine adenylyltransferase
MNDAGSSRELISEIKLMLQQELSEVKDSMNEIRLQISDLKGTTVMRQDFEIALEAERTKRQALEAKTIELDKQLSGLENSTKIYMGIATAVASLVASAIAGLLFSP